MRLTKAQEVFMQRVVAGDGWAAPAQMRMAWRLQSLGLIIVTDERRHNFRRGTSEVRCIVPRAGKAGA